MKKLFLFMMAAMLIAFTSCVKDDMDAYGLGGEQTIKLSVEMPKGKVETRAAYEDPSTDQEMRLFVYVLYEGKIVEIVENGTKHDFSNNYTKDIRVVPGKEYKLAVWADFGNSYYTVNGVENEAPTVAMVSSSDAASNAESSSITIKGSDNERDAYYAIEDLNITENQTKEVKLKRPFGLVKISTVDYEDEAVVNAGLLPEKYSTTIEVPTEMNLEDGTLIEGSKKNVTISGDVANIEGNDANGELSYDYFFATDVQGNLPDFTVKYTKGETDIVSYEFTNIPIRRNYKTNVSGNILTKTGGLDISIDPIWTGNIDASVTPEKLQSAIDNVVSSTSDNVVIAVSEAIGSDDVTDNTLKMPNTDKNVTLVIPDINVDLKIEEKTDNDYTGNLTLQLTDVSGTSNNVEVVLPNSTVTVEKGTFSTFTATTAENTLIVGEEAEINTLTVNAGNVKIYGEVGTITKGESYNGKITYNVSTVSQLRKFAEKVNSSDSYEGKVVVLDNDIDLMGENWDTPIGDMNKSFKGEFDGNGKTIRNLKIEGLTADKACGLFGRVGGKVMNLTVDGVEINHIVNGDNGGIAVIAGSLYTNGQVENSIVRNAVLNGNRWMGGVAGYVYGHIKNCTVENISLTAVPDNLSRSYDNGDKVGGIVGYSAVDNHGEISGNNAKNVSIKGYRDLGGIAGAAKASALTNNTVTNVKIRIDQTTNSYGPKDKNAAYLCGRNLGGELGTGNTEAGENSVGIFLNALPASFEANTTYYLQEGEYTNGTTINADGVNLVGDGSAAKVIINNNINVAADNISISNLTVNSASGDAIYTEGTSNITFNVENVTVNKTGGATCIRVSDAANVVLNVKNSNLIIKKNNMRGINFYDLTEGGKCVVNVDNTHIGPKAEIMGYGDYNDEQNAVFVGLTDTRGIGVGTNVDGLEINLKNNSVVEGIFYAINVIPAAGPVDVNVENSTLDGRCAFNLWGRNENGTNTFNVKNSKLVGRNPFGGSTEKFATIVFNFGRGSNFSEPKNNHVIVEDSEIYCYNNPETSTNEQLAADMRSWDTNKLELKGNTVIYDRSTTSRLEYAVNVASSDNECVVGENVKFLNRKGEPKNKPIVNPGTN